MWHRRTAATCRTLLVIAAAALALSACHHAKVTKDAGTTSSTTTTSTSPPSSTSSSTSASSGSTSNTPTTFGTVPTSTTLSPAETALDKDYVPEADMGFEFGRDTINGVSYSNALEMRPSSSSTTQLQINAGRRMHRFLGDLGIPDDQHSTNAYKVEISLDGSAPIVVYDIRFGETKKIDIDVTNALRIKVSVTPVSVSGYDNQLAIGSPRFG